MGCKGRAFFDKNLADFQYFSHLCTKKRCKSTNFQLKNHKRRKFFLVNIWLKILLAQIRPFFKPLRGITFAFNAKKI